MLLPEPERPVRMTSWRSIRQACGLELAACTERDAGSAFHPALVRAGDAHVFAIFRHGAAGDVNAVVVELLGDLIVGERLGAVFFLDHFLDQALQREQRHAAALGTVDGFAEERAQLEHALRRVRVLAGDGAADGRRMHADFFGDFLDHHGLQRVRAVNEEIALARDDRLADAQNRVLALLDIFHQLDRGGEAFFDVVAHVAVGGILHQQAAIGGAQAQLRHVVFVQEGLPLIVDFAEVDVGLDQPRLGLVVAQAGTRIELLDHVERALDDVERAIQGARDIFQLIRLHLLQMFGDDLLRERVVRIEGFELQQQAFAQIARADADGIEILHDGERIVEIVLRVLAFLGQLFHRRGQVAVLVQVADDAFGEFPHRVGANRDAQLPGEMIGKAGRGGKKLLERWALGNFAFLRLAAVAAGIEILIEEGADIEFVEGIRFRLLGNFFGFGFEEGFVGVVVGLRRLFALLFEDGIGDHLLVDHLAQLETIEREDAHHLDQTRRQNLLLRHLQIQFESLPGHGCLPSCPFRVPRLVQAEVIAQIHAPDFRVVAQLVGPALPEDFAISEDVCAVGDAECFPHVMIRDQDANARTA